MKNIEFNEYGEKVCACFKPNAPMCPAQAIIPTLTVENRQGIKGLTNCLVRVADINTTYYIDDKGRIAQTWAGPVVEDNYDYEENPLELRDQLVYDFANGIIIIYDARGRYQIFDQHAKDFDEITNRPKYAGAQMTSETNIPDVDVSIAEHNTDTNAHPAIQNRLTTAEGDIVGLSADIDDINDVIPAQATENNKLADKNFVNSSLNSITAFYITKNAAGDQFATYAELAATTVFYSGGVVRVPTRNDYCIVQADETKADPVTGENPTTRYIFQNDQWEFQYTVNKTTLTAVQLATLNSGFVAADRTKLNGIEAGAQVNKLEGVQINGIDLVVTSKKVNIPTATDSTFGVLKSTANTIKVLTQAEYDALATKDSATLYFIKEA